MSVAVKIMNVIGILQFVTIEIKCLLRGPESLQFIERVPDRSPPRSYVWVSRGLRQKN